MVADAREHRRDHAQPLSVQLFALFGLDRVLGIQMQPLQIREHAEYRLTGLLLKPIQAGQQQPNITAKAVDDKAADARALGRGQAFERTEEMREHTAAVDVGHQHTRAVHAFRKTHIGDVAIAQVDLGRTAGAFHQHTVVLRLQPAIRLQHRRHRARLVLVVGARVHVEPRLAVNDDLRAGIGTRAMIHINTEIRVAFTEALRETIIKMPEETTPYKILTPGIEAMKKVIEEKLKIFGSVNKI